MSELYVDNEGYKPQILPERGEDLMEGRQYALTPLARLVLEREYGYGGLPTVLECLLRKVCRTTITTHTFNHETRKHKVSRLRLDPQEETFRAFTAGGIVKFSFSIAKLDELAPFYDPSHSIPGAKWGKTDIDKLAKLEDDWFNTRHLPSTHRKVAGRTLRWWSKHEIVDGKYVLLPEYRRQGTSGTGDGRKNRTLGDAERASISNLLSGL
jgi:hypothetical protein